MLKSIFIYLFTNLNFRDLFKVITLFIVVVSVLLIGLPYGPFKSLSGFLQNKLEPFGIDVAMTPITADMTMMMDRTEVMNLYQTNPQVDLLTNVQKIRMAGKSFDFYQFKLPAMLYLELYANGLRCRDVLWSVCHNLREKEPDTRGFVINLGELGEENSFLEKQGFNIEHKCIE